MLTPTRALGNGASSLDLRMWVCATVVVSGLASAVPVGAQVLRVEWVGQRLTVAAQNVPLSTVLTEVARQTGSSVVGLEKATETVTLDITSATLRDGLRTMLADKNYIYIQRYSETTHAYDRVKLYALPDVGRDGERQAVRGRVRGAKRRRQAWWRSMAP